MTLPAPLTSLIGRERDREKVAAQLASARLVTLTGAAGVGKTRLAIEVAARGEHDGVWWIELAALGDSAAVVSTLAAALGVRPLPGASELDAAIGFLWSRRALVVLDNCEHVLEEVARVAAALLSACPSLSLLATSRAPLRIPGETRWEVAPLSVPSGDGLAALSGSDAARLFIDRAGRVGRRWPLSDDGARAIAEICRELEGMPLALELAAARAAVLSPMAIARGLDDALGLLTARSPATVGRHQTLRASLDWSYGLLPADAQTLLRRLGVFAGGTTLELAREVCRMEPLAALETLVEHSLVQVESDRYRLLETVRQYAVERLEEAGERDSLRDRHRDAFLALAERGRREALTPRQPEVFAALDPEAANLAAALEHALETDAEKALRVCMALDFWWRARARFREADGAFARALAASEPPPARALAAWAWIVGNGGDFARANELAAQAARRAEAERDPDAIAITLLVLANHRFFTDPLGALDLLRRCRDLGVDDAYIAGRAEALVRGVAWFQQDAEACLAGFDELLARLEALGDRETLAWFWFEQGAIRYPLGEHAEAADAFRRAVAVAAEIGEPTADRAARTYLALLGVAAGHAQWALGEMLAIHAQTLLHGGSFAFPWIELLVAQAEAAGGRVEAARTRLATLVEIEAWGAAHAFAWALCELAEVRRLLGEDPSDEASRAVAAAEALGNPWLAAKARLTRSRLAAGRGEWAAAERLAHEALGAIAEHGLRLELPAAFEALAEVAAGLERSAEAARILGAAARARDELGLVAWPAQRAEVDALAEGLRELDGARAEGAALTRDEAVAWLRRARGERKRPRHGWESLTPTEIAVIRQAAAGLTNPQIAERLFIARATVKTHLSNIYAKLGVQNRSQLAAQAAWRLPPDD